MIFPGMAWTPVLGFIAFFIAGALIRVWTGSGVWAAVGGVIAGCLTGAVV